MPLNYKQDYPDGMSAINDPAKLLLPAEVSDWRKGVLLPFYFGAIGLFFPLMKNFSRNVPLNTGIYQYPICFLIGAATGKLFEDYRNSQLALRDAHYRQYIRDHPQDFEPEARKKVGELFKAWVPIR